MHKCYKTGYCIVPFITECDICQHRDPRNNRQNECVADKFTADDRSDDVVARLLTEAVGEYRLDFLELLGCKSLLGGRINGGITGSLIAESGITKIGKFGRNLIDRDCGITGDSKLGSGRKVDTEVHESSAACSIEDAGDQSNTENCKAGVNEILRLLDVIISADAEVELCFAFGNIRDLIFLNTEQFRFVIKLAGSDKLIEQPSGERNVDDKRTDDRDDQHGRKAAYGTVAPDIHDETGNQCCELGIENCGEGLLLTFRYRSTNRAAFIEFLTDTLIADDIGVNGHTDTKYQCADGGQCEYGTHQTIESEYCPDICRQHDDRDKTRKTILPDHECKNEQHADQTGNCGTMQCICAVLRADNVTGNLSHLDRKRSGIDQLCECPCFCVCEVSFNDAVTVDGAAYGCRTDILRFLSGSCLCIFRFIGIALFPVEPDDHDVVSAAAGRNVGCDLSELVLISDL